MSGIYFKQNTHTCTDSLTNNELWWQVQASVSKVIKDNWIHACSKGINLFSSFPLVFSRSRASDSAEWFWEEILLNTLTILLFLFPLKFYLGLRVRPTNKAQVFLYNCTHPPYVEFNLLPKRLRYALLRYRTKKTEELICPCYHWTASHDSLSCDKVNVILIFIVTLAHHILMGWALYGLGQWWNRKLWHQYLMSQKSFSN